MAILLVMLTGCQSAPSDPQALAQLFTKPKPFVFNQDQRPAVHAAAIEVLREHGFRIARNDFRFGTITTYPKESPTFAEFWIDDATTRDQRRADTLNAHQRSVTLTTQSMPGFDLSDPKSGRAPDDSDKLAAYYRMTVEVFVERLQRPDRYLTHSATAQLSATYTTTPTHLNDRGIDGPYAQPLTRDPALEDRLLKAIQAATESFTTPQDATSRGLE